MSVRRFHSLLAIATGILVFLYYSTKEDLRYLMQTGAYILPPLQASTLDYSQARTVEEKKQIFFDTLRPIIYNRNRLIRDDRQRILFAREHGIDQAWLSQLAQRYKLAWNPRQPDWQALLQRVDTIPVELVMAQAANESAWGQSRFAQQANNLFGQWCFRQGCGIVPGRRDEGKTHEIRAFDSINDSVESYMHNINTSRAYRKLRLIRARLRQQDEPLSGLQLANGLNSYSSRGQAYVREVKSIIRTNWSLIHRSE